MRSRHRPWIYLEHLKTKVFLLAGLSQLFAMATISGARTASFGSFNSVPGHDPFGNLQPRRAFSISYPRNLKKTNKKISSLSRRYRQYVRPRWQLTRLTAGPSPNEFTASPNSAIPGHMSIQVLSFDSFKNDNYGNLYVALSGECARQRAFLRWHIRTGSSQRPITLLPSAKVQHL